MNKFFEKLEGVKHISSYLSALIAIALIVAFFCVKDNWKYQKQSAKQRQIDALEVKAKLYQQLADENAHKAVNYDGPDFDNACIKDAIKYQGIADSCLDSVKVLKGE